MLFRSEELSDVERWQKSEDERLEYEGYCNKIRKGLEDLDEKVCWYPFGYAVNSNSCVSSLIRMKVMICP